MSNEGKDYRSDSGRYFPLEEYMTSPKASELEAGSNVTLMIWTIWLSGHGWLVRDSREPAGWSLGHWNDSKLAYLAAATERVTSVSISDLQPLWHFPVLRKHGTSVSYWLDGQPVDEWEARYDTAPKTPWQVMKDVEGFAADFAIFDKYLPDSRIEELWELGRERASE